MLVSYSFFHNPTKVEKSKHVGPDNESLVGGGSPGAPVDHHLPSLHPQRPTPSSGTDTEKHCGATPPRFRVATPCRGVGRAGGTSEFCYLFSGSLLGLSCARFFNIQFVLQLISFYR